MSSDYLSDSNFASALFVTKRTDHPKALAFAQKIRAVGGRIFISRVAIAEIQYGIAVNPTLDALVKKQMEVGIKAFQVKEIGEHTTPEYAQIRAELFIQKAPRHGSGKIRRGLRPESFTALMPTALELGIQENDLWMAAMAVERKMKLISGDKMNQLKSVFPSLDLENWQI